MLGKTILHYHIIEELGRGGMGVVYKAQDTKLERTVALKFLPPHMLADKEAELRFISEAKAASSFDHPNICTIHDIGKTDDDQLFIAMACYEGETLKKKIEKGPFKIGEAIDIVSQVAEGLKKAHQMGIVHRDIKPANIFITNDGIAKILDFGLAKVSAQTQMTTMGTTMGTVAYMSPEQTRGEEVDNRTDIWSFGVVLYEMLTGQLPFKGDYEQAIIYSILNEEVKTYSDKPSSPIQKVINKLLEKNPDKRYFQVSEILKDLHSIENKTAGVDQKKSISKDEIKKLAVLPFINIRNDEETNYLGFAVSDRIIGSLAYIKNILVRPSSAIRSYQNQTVDIKIAANELNVDFILTGNFLKEANEIRLDLELIDINSDKMLWREDFEVKFENAFKLQDIVTEKVIQGLQVQFSKVEQGRIKTNIPDDPIAYEYYLRGVSYPHTNEGDHLAIQILRNAVELDPAYAPAYSELGFRLASSGVNALKGAEASKEAEECQLKALSLNSGLLSPLGWLANLYTESGRTEKAFDFSKQMLKINPNNSQAHFCLSYLLRYTGMLNESVKEAEIALALDPQNPVFRSLGYTYFYMGNYQKAIELFGIDKRSVMGIAWKGFALLLMGNKIDSIKYFDEAIVLEPEGHLGFHFGAIRAVELGDLKEGLRYANKWEKTNPQDSEAIYNLANTYAYLGDKESCFRILEKAIKGGFFCYPYMLIDPLMNSVRNEDKFNNLLNVAKSKHKAFKKKFYEK